MPFRLTIMRPSSACSDVIPSEIPAGHSAVGIPSRMSTACVLSLLALLGFLFSPAAEAQSAIMTGTVSYVQPQSKTGNGYLDYLQGVAVDSSGNLYIMDGYNNRIVKEIPNGSGGYSEVVVVSNDTQGHGLAVDSKQDVFFCTYSGASTCYVVPYTGSGTTGYGTANVVQTHATIGDPKGLAVDGSGNLFISAYSQTEIIEETPTGSGATPYATTIEQVVISNTSTPAMGSPYGAGSIDSAGNYYIPTYNQNTIVKATQNGTGGYTLSKLISSGLSSPTGTFVDASGNLFVIDQPAGAPRLLEYTGCATTCVQHVIASGLATGMPSFGIDPAGNLYYPGAYPTAIFSASTNAITKFSLGEVNYGNVAIGSTATQFLNFVFTATSTLNATTPVTVSALGGTSIDFAVNPTATVTLYSTTSPFAATVYTPSTCVASASFTAASGSIYSCTIGVKFSPTQAGVRTAVVSLISSTGTILGTGYISGIGVAPQVAFLPGIESNVATSTAKPPAGIFVDVLGSVYAAYPAASQVKKYTYATGSYAALNIGSSLGSPNSVAVDANGNVYIADSSKNAIFIEPYSGGSYGTQTTLPTSTLSAPSAVAVDRYGNIYIADTVNNRVIGEFLGPLGTYTESVIASGLGLPTGVAVAPNGNVYISDTQNSRILLEAPTTANSLMDVYPVPTYTQSVVVTSYLSSPGALSVDAIGNLYIVDAGSNNRVLEEQPTAGGYNETQVSTSTLITPSGVAIATNGNIYVADAGSSRILEETIASAPSLTFTAEVGASSFPQAVTFENIGNGALNFTAFSSGTNPAVPAGYTLSTSATNACPAVTTTSASIAAGGACQLVITFTPTTVGANNATIAIADNNLGSTTPSVQNIALNGTATAAAETIFWNPASSITYGTTLANLLNAVAEKGSASVAGTFAYTATPTGGSASSVTAATLLAPGTYLLNATFTPTDLVNYQVQTLSYPLTVNKAQPAISWAPSFTILVGSTLSNVLNATASLNGTTIAGTITYTATLTGGSSVVVTSPTILPNGTYSMLATFTPTNTTLYKSVGVEATLVVNLLTPKITWSAAPSIVYGADLSTILVPTATFGSSNTTVAGTFTYTALKSGGTGARAVTSSTLLTGGSWTLTATFTPSISNTYGVVTATYPLTVAQAAPIITLTSSVAWQTVNNLVTLTATVTSPLGTPTGTVAFYNGPNLLGNATLSALATAGTNCSTITGLNCNNVGCPTTAIVGLACYSITQVLTGIAPVLSVGIDPITAVYSSDSNFLSETSSVVPIQVYDFSIIPVQPSIAITPQGVAVYTLNFTPISSATFPQAVSWTVTGAPTNAVVTLSSATTAANSGPTPFTLTVALLPKTGDYRKTNLFGNRGVPMALCLLLLPLAVGLRLNRKQMTARMLSLALLIACGGACILGLNGCGTAVVTNASSQYYLTITGSTGTLSHATTVNLNVLTQ